jgi:catechol 2,3-dioxygenase-like lactoylglutathione lyase family enzyme
MVPTKLDHCVIKVTDWERSNKFYSEVMGAELVQRPAGWAYRFGDKQLNVHGPGVAPAEVARLPVQRSGRLIDGIHVISRQSLT